MTRSFATRTLLSALLGLVGACPKATTSARTEPPLGAVDPEPAKPVAEPAIAAGVPGGVVIPPPIETSPPIAATATPAQRARVEAIRDREMAIVTLDPRFKALMRRGAAGITDRKEAYDRGLLMGRALSSRGIPRFSDGMLEQWMRLRLKLAKSTELACAGLWSGEMSNDVFIHALALLDDDTIADFMHITAEATLAELAAVTPLVQDKAAIGLGVVALKDTLSSDDRNRFIAILEGTSPSTADQCFASLVLHERVDRLDHELRLRFIRALAASMAEP